MSPEKIVDYLKLFSRVVDKILHKRYPVIPPSPPSAENNFVADSVVRPISEAEKGILRKTAALCHY